MMKADLVLSSLHHLLIASSAQKKVHRHLPGGVLMIAELSVGTTE
jgi:hypothetical protein